jgi:hypothetical protein
MTFDHTATAAIRPGIFASLCTVLALMMLCACGGGAASSSGTGGGPPGGGSPGAIAFSSATYAVAQTAGKVTVSVTRSGGTAGAAGVQYQTSDGTAAAGALYTAAGGTLTWGDGDGQPKSFEVTLNTTPFSGNRSFTATLTNASGAALGSPVTATASISGSLATTGGAAAAALAAKLGKPARFLVGLGGQGTLDPVAIIQAQALTPDIYERYLVGAGSGDWTTWNSPAGAYVGIVATAAHGVGAVPMYTLYQMATNGDGNLAGLTNAAFMATYWSNVRLMYQQIAAFHAPALVNLEPDFWGYSEQRATNGDPSTVAALVTANADCVALTNDAKGVAGCLILMARKYAPQAYVGLPYSTWGGSTTAAVVAFMQAIGAQNADFIVAQTLDRDAGCFEVQSAADGCVRSGSGWYWDAANQTHPNFADHLAVVSTLHAGLGNLPVIWWQTPLGAPSTTPGGPDYHFRDNREQYFLTHPDELTAVGGLGVVFSTGENHQTNLTTDGGQFQSLSKAYFAAPAALP